MKGLRMRMAGLLILAAASGCAYTTRTRLPEYAKSIAIPVFANKSYNDEYTRHLEVELTEAVRKTFLQTGQLKVAGREEAQLILEGEVMRMERKPLRVDRFGEPAETQLRIMAKVSLYDVKEAKYIFQNQLVTNDELHPESGAYNLRRGENENLGRQRAIEDLGRQIARKVLDHW